MFHVYATVVTEEISAFAAVATPMTVAILWILGAMIDRKNAQLLKDINGTYLRRTEAELKFESIDVKFEGIDRRFEWMDKEGTRQLREERAANGH